jgi:hypothetical protein
MFFSGGPVRREVAGVTRVFLTCHKHLDEGLRLPALPFRIIDELPIAEDRKTAVAEYAVAGGPFPAGSSLSSNATQKSPPRNPVVTLSCCKK